jgi:hypothetical protein
MSQMNRREFAFKLLPSLLLLPACGERLRSIAPLDSREPSLATQWLEVALEATARAVDRDGPRPTVLSRTLAIPMTAMFDAWAAYDSVAVGTQLGAGIRRPASERTVENKQRAIGQAMVRTLIDVYPTDAEFIAQQATRLGVTSDDAMRDPSNPVGIGNLVADAIIASRKDDGANASNRYVDTTGYVAKNSVDKIIDPDRWQPIEFTRPDGSKVAPGFLTPHWSKVKPFALRSADQFRPGPPPKVGSVQLLREITEVVELNASLTCQQKAVVEFMRDGPRSTGQAGHWLRFAQLVSARDKFDLDQDVRLYFAVASAALDAFIAAWDAKIFYDSARPWTLSHHVFATAQIQGWGGPDRGAITMPGSQWHPYSPPSFVTPPFPGYVSGHSCVSAACAEALRLFTGSDHFGQRERRRCGELTGEHLQETIDLELATFTGTAEMAGLSRVLGGYHIAADNIEGLALGRRVAAVVWQRVQAHVSGKLA